MAEQDGKPVKPGLWEAKANPHGRGFGPLDFDDPELSAKAREALAAEQAKRDAPGYRGPFDRPVDPPAEAPTVLSLRPELPAPGTVVRHYKGGLYTVLAHAGDCEMRGGVLVVYQSHATGQAWYRTPEVWLQRVTWPDGVERRRFEPEPHPAPAPPVDRCPATCDGRRCVREEGHGVHEGEDGLLWEDEPTEAPAAAPAVEVPSDEVAEVTAAQARLATLSGRAGPDMTALLEEVARCPQPGRAANLLLWLERAVRIGEAHATLPQPDDVRALLEALPRCRAVVRKDSSWVSCDAVATHANGAYPQGDGYTCEAHAKCGSKPLDWAATVARVAARFAAPITLPADTRALKADDACAVCGSRATRRAIEANVYWCDAHANDEQWRPTVPWPLGRLATPDAGAGPVRDAAMVLRDQPRLPPEDLRRMADEARERVAAVGAGAGLEALAAGMSYDPGLMTRDPVAFARVATGYLTRAAAHGAAEATARAETADREVERLRGLIDAQASATVDDLADRVAEWLDNAPSTARRGLLVSAMMCAVVRGRRLQSEDLAAARTRADQAEAALVELRKVAAPACDVALALRRESVRVGHMRLDMGEAHDLATLLEGIAVALEGR